MTTNRAFTLLTVLAILLSLFFIGSSIAYADESDPESVNSDFAFDFDSFDSFFADTELEDTEDEPAHSNPSEGAVYENAGDVWIEDEAGAVVLSSAEGDFDDIVEHHGSYYLVHKDASDFYRTLDTYGVFCIDGSWPIPMQGFEHPLRYFGGDVYGTCISESDAFDYSMDLHFYSLDSDVEFTICNVRVEFPHYYGGRRLPEDTFEPEYNALFCDGKTFVVTKDGVVGCFGGDIEYPTGERFSNVGPYADGGFVYFYDGLYFLDCSTMQSTLIWEETDKIVDLYPAFGGRGASSYEYSGGLLTLRVLGADGNTYDVTIDKKGNIVEAPPTPDSIEYADIYDKSRSKSAVYCPPNDSTPTPVIIDTPKTGDNNHPVLFAALLILSTSALIGLIPLVNSRRKH